MLVLEVSLEGRAAMRKPSDIAAISRILRSDVAEYSLAEPGHVRARGSWGRLADAEITGPINGQDDCMVNETG